MWVGFCIWSVKGKVSCINSQVWNYLQLVYLCCRLAFARMQIPGLPSCVVWFWLALLALVECYMDTAVPIAWWAWGWKQRSCFLVAEYKLLISGDPKQLCAVCSDILALSSCDVLKGHLRASAECRLDLANFLISDLGWLLQRLCRYLCKGFPTSSVLIGFTNLEVTLNKGILCWTLHMRKEVGVLESLEPLQLCAVWRPSGTSGPSSSAGTVLSWMLQ